MERTTRTYAVVLSVRVPLNAGGGLVDGAARVVGRLEAVETVDDPQVRGIEPGLNDTTVELDARVDLSVSVGDRGEDTAIARRQLDSGVGILAVDTVGAIEPDSESDTVAARERSSDDGSGAEQPANERAPEENAIGERPIG